MKVRIYISANKEREVSTARLLSEGFKRHGEEVETIPTESYAIPKGDTQVAVMVGLKGKSKRIYEDHRRSGRHVLLVDKAYFDRKEYCRLSLDGFQSPYLGSIKRPPDRLDALGISLAPKRASGKHIIYAGSSQKYSDWHDLGDANDYAEGWCHTLNKLKSRHDIRDMPLIYRPKPSWVALHGADVRRLPHTTFSGPEETLASLLKDCHLLVTHGSNAAVEAMAAGVPVLLISSEGASAVWSIAEKDCARIADPSFPTDKERRRLFSDLAYWQFSGKEMASGFAWDILKAHTVKGLELSGMSEAEQTIELYRMMHRGPKVFRGGSMKGHIEAVSLLVKQYGAETLLDYGSGKGLQYDEMGLHNYWGGIKPTCYDPGYAPIATKPEGKFDGTICTDVAEHVPESVVDDFLRDVISYATKFAFFCIFTNPSRKFLPDGRNCHVTVREPDWWLDRICKVNGLKPDGQFNVRKALPGGGFEDFPHFVLKGVPHHLLRGEGKPDVIVTFRGE